MRGLVPVHLVLAVCIFASSVALLGGCSSKSNDSAAAPPVAADAKMGNDYGKGVAASHAQQGTPQANH